MERESRGDGEDWKTGGREDVSLRGMPKASEAIHNGLASTMLPAYGLELFYYEDHEENNGIRICSSKLLKVLRKRLVL